MKNIALKGYEHYLISEDGKVYNTIQFGFGGKKLRKTPKELKSYPNKNTGYYTVVLRNGIKAKAVYVHRLVALTYIKNPLKLPEVNHINHNKADNSVSNLEWVTKKQNMQHRNKNGRSAELYNSIINNSELLTNGITLYKKIGRIDVVAELWNVSYPTARKVLINNDVEIYKKNLIPIYIKKELIEAYKNNNHWKRRHLRKYALDTYGIMLTGYSINSIIKNRKEFTLILNPKKIEKNITQKTVFDFSFDI